ncbi:hypothetical protein crov523 [Cafeteria roenbergensis virus]|uniref:ParB/Sulfiredoxin domain-containing protein n=1 Tax=Cafeteria roenbergensis virus (strain BV-PW1) TaxID=693272 RepID=E3T5U4_CROVB|nr:hypothetical protein crov523 [Cafeteria roenbergensis virus BV-PW1]ADO67557.1 hypothetical protein crov523 [Cafeteria roenbergensis virus BV-PW1]
MKILKTDILDKSNKELFKFLKRKCNNGHSKLVKINLINIEFKNWNKNRYLNLKTDENLIGNYILHKPVIICDYSNNKYQLLDGNHRCFVCNELWFEYIYAFLPKRFWKNNNKYMDI